MFKKYPKGIKRFLIFFFFFFFFFVFFLLLLLGTNALTAICAGIFGQLINANQFISFNSGKISRKEMVLFNGGSYFSVQPIIMGSFAYLIPLNTLLILNLV